MENLTRAKEYTQVEPTDPRFLSFLYVALRYIEVPFIQSINLLNANFLDRLKKDVIQYNHLFTIDNKSVLGIFTVDVREKEEKIKKFIEKNRIEPTGNVENIILLEALISNSRGPKHFMRLIGQLTEEVKLCHSELTDKTIEDFIG